MKKEEILEIIKFNLNENEIKQLIEDLLLLNNKETKNNFSRNKKLDLFINLFKGRDDCYPI